LAYDGRPREAVLWRLAGGRGSRFGIAALHALWVAKRNGPLK
jgi:hypothetical protein